MPREWLEKAGVCCCSSSEKNTYCNSLSNAIVITVTNPETYTPCSCLMLGQMVTHRSLAFSQETFLCKPFMDPVLQKCPNLHECYTSLLFTSNMQNGYYHKNTFLQFLKCHSNNIFPYWLFFSTLKSLCSKEAEAIQCHLTLHLL